MSDTETAPSTESRQGVSLSWVFSLAVIAVAVLAAAGAVVVVRAGRAQDTSAAPVVATTMAPGSAAPATSSCTPAAQASGGAITSAPPTTWTVEDTLALPVTTAGPGAVATPYATCFAPTTLGALTAAAQIYLRANVTGGDLVRARQTTPDSQLRSAEAVQDWATHPRSKPWPQLYAFRTGAVTNNRVDVTLQLSVPAGQTPQFTFAMSWDGTDWLLGPVSQGDASLPGMIVWERV